MNREPPMRWLIFAVSVSALAASAAVAQSMQIHGVTGYLSEYDLSAVVSGEAASGMQELSGPLTIKHVGLCSHDGPNENSELYQARIRERVSPCHGHAEFRWSRVQLSRLLVGILQWRLDLHRWAEPAAKAVGTIGLRRLAGSFRESERERAVRGRSGSRLIRGIDSRSARERSAGRDALPHRKSPPRRLRWTAMWQLFPLGINHAAHSY